MKRHLGMIFGSQLWLTAFLFGSATVAQDLPVSVRVDMAIIKLESSIVAEDHAAVLEQIDAIRALDPASADGELLFFEAESALALDDLDRGEHALARFLSEVGRESTNYEPALKLMIDMPIRRAADAERLRAVEAERERQDQEAAEAGRQQAEQNRAAERLAQERDLGLLSQELQHIRWILQQSWGVQTHDTLLERSPELTQLDREALHGFSTKTDFVYEHDMDRSYLTLEIAEYILNKPLSPIPYEPAAYAYGRDIEVENHGDHWLSYNIDVECFIETRALDYTSADFFIHPVMSFSRRKSSIEHNFTSIFPSLVDPSPFREDHPIYAWIDGVRFDLESSYEYVAPARWNESEQSQRSFLRALRAATEPVLVSGTSVVTGYPLDMSFSASGFTAAFRRMTTDCNLPGFARMID